MYLGACTTLDLKPEQVAMVAAHIYDLRAAASFGVRPYFQFNLIAGKGLIKKKLLWLHLVDENHLCTTTH